MQGFSRLLTISFASVLAGRTAIRANDGSLDPSFGAAGIVQTQFTTARDIACGVAIQSNGKIVAAGFASDGNTFYQAVLARYDTAGNLDPGFGIGGKVWLPNIYAMEPVFSVALQSDGKIVAVGTAWDSDPNTAKMLVLRLLPDGSLDPSFGSGGRAYAIFPAGGGEAQAVTIDHLGRIVVAGFCYDPQNLGWSDIALARFLPSGVLDRTFGLGGTVTVPTGSGNDSQAYSVAIDPSEKILTAGQSALPFGSYQFALLRLNVDGTLDSSFGTGGVVLLASPMNARAKSIACHADGRVVTGGVRNGGAQAAVWRFTNAGVLDTTFGSGGESDFTYGGSNAGVEALAVQSDGRIDAVGVSLVSGGVEYLGVARLTEGGALDPTFGVGGTVQTDVTGTDYGFALAIQGDGGIIVAGASDFRNDAAFLVARYLVACPPVGLSPASMPAGDVGLPYAASVSASGGTGSYSYSLDGGSLPAGLSLSTSGTISGTPSNGGVFGFTVAATDSGGCSGQHWYQLTIEPVSASVRFYTVAPCRLLDTRRTRGPYGGPALPANTSRTIPIAGQCGIPAGAVAVAGNVTAVNETALGDLRIYPTGTPVPNASAINFGANQARANNAILSLVGSSTGNVEIQCDMPAGSTNVVLDVSGYFQ